jgi:hypothetical protein
VPDTSYDGAAEVRRIRDWIVTVSVKIGDVGDPGWLGQITSHWPAETFAPGPVTVILHDGDRNGWSAPANVDAAGALRGEAAFTRDPPPD